MVTDNTCDLICPQVPGVKPRVAHCCSWCPTARKDYVSETNKHLWSEESGFLGPDGCRLKREDMPVECRQYTCKDTMWMRCSIRYAPLVWNGRQWLQLTPIEGHFIGMADEVDELLMTLGRAIRKRNAEAKTEKNDD